MNMEIKATIYDILGYLTIGIVGGLVWLLAYEHSVGCDWTCVRQVLTVPTTVEIMVLLIFAYLLGHAIASLGSLVLEKSMRKLRLFERYYSLDKITSDRAHRALTDKFKEVFGFPFRPNDFRLCVCYAESAAPKVYQTAFVFLTFYGMARSLALVFVSYGIWEVANAGALRSWGLVLWATAGFAAATTFFYHYLRFLKYFTQHIVGAVLVGSEHRVDGESDPGGRNNDQNVGE
jgi:hypothetical protein